MILHEYLYKYLLQIILFRDAADTFFFTQSTMITPNYPNG